MSSLIQLQRDFQAYVYGKKASMLAYVVGDAQLTSEERLNVYAEAYCLRLSEVLSNEFPGLKVLAGEQGFEVLVQAYIKAYPSSNFNVRWYGENLAEFMSRTEPWAKEPALTEMAKWEWTISLAFDAMDESTMTDADISAVAVENWPVLIPVPQNAMRSLWLDWNVAAIRKAVDEQLVVPELCLLQTPERRLVWRKTFTVYHRALEPDEAWALEAAIANSCFGELCEGLCRWHDEKTVPLRAAALLRRWVEDGLLSSFRLLG